MVVYFRVDASVLIGSGHIMRCLALAEALRESCAEIAFISRKLEGNLIDIVQRRGFTVHSLPYMSGVRGSKSYSDWLQADSRIDAAQTLDILAAEKKPIDWLVVDHYGLDGNWEDNIRHHVKRIMAIDDLANRPHTCDLLLDQSVEGGLGGRYEGLVSPHCMRLLGPRYALLRPEFAWKHQAASVRSGTIQRVLVFFGGADSSNETAKAVEALLRLGATDVSVDVVIGAAHPDVNGVSRLCEGKPWMRIHRHVDHFAELLESADLAIGAGGMTAIERCCLGLPTITVAVAENQQLSCIRLAEEGQIFFLGRGQDTEVEDILSLLTVLRRMPEWVRRVSKAGLRLTDGGGVGRVIRSLYQRQITLRPADIGDCGQVFQWRNAEINRVFSFNESIIAWSDHYVWFRRTLADSNRKLLVGEIDGEPVGVLRYDVKGNEAEVSIYLVPGRHHQGYGQTLIEAGTHWLRENLPGVQRIRAEIRCENKAARSVFRAAGFNSHHIVHIADIGVDRGRR